MAKLPQTFEELVDRLPELGGGGLASAHSPPASSAALRVAQTLVGSLPGSDQRVGRVAAQLDRLVALSRPAAQPRKRTRHG
jgi:hypothetical protein